jgi:hypothetical protein
LIDCHPLIREFDLFPVFYDAVQCVCGVYRAHILQASSKRSGQSPVSVALSHNQSLGDIFLDQSPGTEIPTLDEVISFYQDFYVRSQMEHDTIIMSLIYVELIDQRGHEHCTTSRKLAVRLFSWHGVGEQSMG